MAGILALGYVGLTLLGARSYQAAANQTLDRQIEDEEVFPASLSRTAGREGEVIGRIEIPRLGLAVAILEGTASRTLRAGVGHIAGTALPGETGNIGIAGHRDTYFRTLKDILPGDEIRIQTPTGLSRYEVNWVQIVSPNDAGILAHSPDSAVTLVTCYPFYYVGPAPERYVVHARKMRTPAESPAAETSGMAPTHKE
jgi:sortase A